MSRSEERRDRLKTRLFTDGVDALVVSKPQNVTYLTGFSGDSSYLVLGRDRSVLVSDGRFTTQIAEECPGLDTSIRRTTGVPMADALAKVVGRMRIRRLAYEAAAMTVAELAEIAKVIPKVELVGWGPTVEALRAIKDPDEVAAIREAIGFAESAFLRLRATIRTGDTEKAIADRLEMLVREVGAERTPFETIVAVGARSAMAHARPGTSRVGDGLPLLVDWGAAGRLYKSDLTRVLVLNRIPAKLEAVYEVVLKAQKRAIKKIRPGIKAMEVDAAARSTIAEAGFGRLFTHSTGHGIGMEVHEAPGLKTKSDMVLVPGMVVTVEPGIYLRGWGGVRIEDDVLVTPDGCDVLSTLPKGIESVLVA
jgi:Xaa-Pro aminopeptidase